MDKIALLAEVSALRKRVAALECERDGLAKANSLLNAGMGSVCEGRDELKLRCRTLESENAELRERCRAFAAEQLNADEREGSD